APPAAAAPRVAPAPAGLATRRVHRHRRTGLQPRRRALVEAAPRHQRPATHGPLRQPVGLGLAGEACGKDRPQRGPGAVPGPGGSAAREELRRGPARPRLAALPGSRVGEIERLAGDFLAAAARVLAVEPALQVVAPMANRHARAAFERVLANHPDAATLQPA